MDGSHAHLIGIGGNGMRALSEVLCGWRWSVSGSDMAFRGHAADHLPANTDIVIYSDAIPQDNPELRRAAELGIPALSYFQTLGAITRGAGCQPALNRWQVGNLPHVIAIAGTHGKSTTTAMIGHILTQADRNPTVFCGAAPIGKTSGGQAGRKDFFVVEACEYRKNFLHLRPTHAAILGIEPDHFDCYRDLVEIEDAFRQFAESLPAGGLLLYRDDCPATEKVVRNLNCRKISFGFSPTADWSAQDLQQEGGYYRFSIFNSVKIFAEVRLPIPGQFNILNALAAAAMCGENGVSAEHIRHGLDTFPGLHRRFEIFQRQIENLSYVMDYAHHPSEVSAALLTAREVFPNRRIWCIFQPHQASRTARLLDKLAISLQNADKVLVAEIFRAREGPPKPGEITAADLARRVNEIAKAEKGEAKVIPLYQTADIIDTLSTQVHFGDVIITLGAGDIHEKIREILEP